MFLRPPMEPSGMRDAIKHPEVDTEWIRSAPIGIQADAERRPGPFGRCLESTAQLQSGDAQGRGGLKSDLECLDAQQTDEHELASFLWRCGNWYMAVRMLKEVRADTLTDDIEWDDYMTTMQELLTPEPDGDATDTNVLAEAILNLAGTVVGGFKNLEAGQAELKADVAELKTDVGELKTGQAELKTGQAELKADVVELKTGQAELKADVVELKTDVAELKTGQNKLNARQARFEKRMDRLEDGIGVIKGDIAIRATRTHIYPIAQQIDGGWIPDKTLSGIERHQILRGLSTPLDGGTMRSFVSADMLVQCQCADGSEGYLAVEASYRLARKDATRAMRNAAILENVSGLPAKAVVSGVKADRHVRALVDSGEVVWYRLSEGELQPD